MLKGALASNWAHHLIDGSVEFLVGDEPADEPVLERLGRAELAAGEREVGGPGQADQPRQQVADAHLPAGQADLDGRDDEHGLGAGHPDVGAQGQSQSRAGRRPVDTRDHRRA